MHATQLWQLCNWHATDACNSFNTNLQLSFNKPVYDGPVTVLAIVYGRVHLWMKYSGKLHMPVN